MLSNHAGADTASFSVGDLEGAYLKDPVTFVDRVASHSPYLAIGGDTGGGQTKIGVTYRSKEGRQTFSCLLVYKGTDN